ncbi:MAG: hypothetical protein ABW100_15590, partial [Candidatus Thiodiazotropha sp. 6PLUC3]
MNITPQIDEFQIQHGKKLITIRRNQDTEAMLEFDFARTSRPCPPFCAQPMQVNVGVLTFNWSIAPALNMFVDLLV